jgi:hypothetical protein
LSSSFHRLLHVISLYRIPFPQLLSLFLL